MTSPETLVQPAEGLSLREAEAQGVHADNCAGARWLVHMLAGNFAAAWRESDGIRQRGAPDPHRFWMGEDVRGRRVIVRCLHGHGDTVQFLRYAPRLRGLASHVTIEVPPAMAEIARCFEGVDDVITWGDGAPAVPPGWDVQVELMELPYLFRTEAHELPIAERYLRLPGGVMQQAARAMCSFSVSRRVGVVWAAGEWNADRSLPLGMLRPLLETPQCEFWSLQGGRAQQEWRNSVSLRDASCLGDGILRLAAAIAQLDLVITVDTLAAHLAGCMGKPAWVLLQHNADWRWMLERSDSLWYPSLRLFRQPSPGDWVTVVAGIERELTRWIDEKSA